MPGFDSHRWVPIGLACIAAPVQATQYLSVEQAQHALFPQADSFAAKAVRLTPELKARLLAQTGVSTRGDEQRTWSATRNGALQGHVLVDEVIGKQELITYALGIGTDGVVRGVEILDYRESYGEERFILIGMAEGAVLTIVHTERAGRFRLISARRATKHEQDDYFSQNF